MSDDKALEFLVSVVNAFRDHALAIIGADEPFVVRGGRWTRDGVVLDYVIESGVQLEGGFSRDAVLQLLARTYQVRSARAVDWVIPPPPDEYQEILETRYPVYWRSGLELGPGWFDLLAATAETLADVDPERDAFAQTKEKMGGLRLYGMLTDAGDPVIEAAELLSFHICDVCGRQGERTSQRGWLATRCDEHRQRHV